MKLKKKVTDHDYDEYISAAELNKLIAEKLAAKLAQANLANKNDISNFVKKTNFDDKLKNVISKKKKKNE